jgi:hypothetical protein
LELEADLSNTAQSVTVLSNNIAGYPCAKTISWDNLAENGTNTYLNNNYQGSVVLLTGVYFGANAGTVTTAANLNMVVTNALGQSARVYLNAAQDNDLVGQTIPAFAYAVEGPLVASTTGYEIIPTRWVDIMTSPLTIATVTHSGNNATITWTAVPFTYCYTVLAASTVDGTYSPIATGLKFSDTNGTYTDTSAAAGNQFYRVTTP